MANKRNPAIGFIFITMVIDVLGIGLIVPLMPTLIRGFTGGDLSVASQYSGWLMASYAIMQFFFSPILGGLSDKYGRRPIILASLFGFSIDYLILANAPDITWLFVGRLLAGITGASFTTAQAYIADISKPEERAKNFGMVGAAFGVRVKDISKADVLMALEAFLVNQTSQGKRCLLVVDEAHATGVLGPDGRGLVAGFEGRIIEASWFGDRQGCPPRLQALRLGLQEGIGFLAEQIVLAREARVPVVDPRWGGGRACRHFTRAPASFGFRTLLPSRRGSRQ